MIGNIERIGSEYLDINNKKSVDNFKIWVEKNKIRKINNIDVWVKLSSSFDYMKLFCSVDLPPGCEHQEFFQGIKGKRYYVYHPYPKTKDWSAISIWNWAASKGISVEILSPDQSWYCPNSTFTIVMTLGDKEKFNKYIKTHKKTNEKWGGQWDVW